MVDVIFADVAQPDQTRIVALNAHNFLKNGGHFVISIKVRWASERSQLHAFMKIAFVEVDLKSELMVKDIFANFFLLLFIFDIFLYFSNL